MCGRAAGDRWLAAGTLAEAVLVAVLGWIASGQLLAQSLPGPAEAPDRWLLAFVDVETTGLEPDYHEMIDIGIVMTDLQGVEIARFFRRIQPQHPERTSPGARAVNAFDANRWRSLGAIEASEAVELIERFRNETAGERSVMLVALNSHFDAAFLDHLFRQAGASWRDLFHYFILDIPSMAWSVGSRQLDGTSLAADLGVDDEPRVAEQHTGMTGAELNARIYRALLERRDQAALPVGQPVDAP